jgi:pantoate--beta-alanine ligase
MKIIRSIKEIKKELARHRKREHTVGLVPTMGYLHEGHLSLVRKARQDNDVVVVSIFVNPVQFGPNEDYGEYPKDLKRDARLCKKAFVDYIFYPTVKSMYPKGYSTFVSVEGLTKNLCGKSRPGHFRGVATVVAKLFNIVKPGAAYFGQKDAQQAMAIKRMAEDLNMNIRIEVMPTVRERDGLAVSSRNSYLTSGERKRAAAIYRSLQLARDLIKSKHKDASGIIREMRKILDAAATKIDYVSIVDPRNLKDVKTITGEVLIAAAVWMGKTRLIDNISVRF